MPTSTRSLVVVAAVTLVAAATLAGLPFVQEGDAATVATGQTPVTTTGTTGGVVDGTSLASGIEFTDRESPSGPPGIPCASPYSALPLRQKAC